jgi:hypothetical protein
MRSGLSKAVAFENALAAKLEEVLLYRILDGELPFFGQDHGGHGDYRFGHGVELKNGVGAQRLFGLDVGEASGVESNDLTVTGNEGYCAGHGAFVGKGFHADWD